MRTPQGVLPSWPVPQRVCPLPQQPATDEPGLGAGSGERAPGPDWLYLECHEGLPLPRALRGTQEQRGVGPSWGQRGALWQAGVAVLPCSYGVVTGGGFPSLRLSPSQQSMTLLCSQE